MYRLYTIGISSSLLSMIHTWVCRKKKDQIKYLNLSMIYKYELLNKFGFNLYITSSTSYMVTILEEDLRRLE